MFLTDFKNKEEVAQFDRIYDFVLSFPLGQVLLKEMMINEGQRQILIQILETCLAVMLNVEW